MNKKWECYAVDENKVNELVNKFGISGILARILVNKNITQKDEIDLFMNPTRKDFHNPFLMPDMEIIVDRVLQALEQKEKIMIMEIMMQMVLQALLYLKVF